MRKHYTTLEALKMSRTWIAQTSLDGGRPDGMNAISRNRPTDFDMGAINDAIADAEATGHASDKSGRFRLFGREISWQSGRYAGGLRVIVRVTPSE